MDLRPIGTEFEIDYGVDRSTTDSRGKKIRYKVTGHESEGEVVEAISIEYYDIDYSKYPWNFTY